MRIGFIGYSTGEFDKNEANIILKDIFNIIDTKYTKVEIVAGATALGIPLLAYQFAARYQYPCIGFMCKKGYDYKLYPCDTIYVYGNEWGDESEKFIDYIDILYKIGGRNQSEKEAQMAKDKKKQVFEYSLKYLGENSNI